MNTEWKRVSDAGFPDDDLTVLIALADGEVCPGFLDAGEWRHLNAELITQPVTHWSMFPLPPTP